MKLTVFNCPKCDGEPLLIHRVDATFKEGPSGVHVSADEDFKTEINKYPTTRHGVIVVFRCPECLHKPELVLGEDGHRMALEYDERLED